METYTKTEMSLKSVVAWFALIYVGVLVVALILIVAFGIEKNIHADTFATILATSWSVRLFRRKNNRQLAPTELRNAVLGMICADAAIQFSFVLLRNAFASTPLPIYAAVVAILMVVAIEAVFIYVLALIGNRNREAPRTHGA